MIRVKAASQSHQGLVRTNNEDGCFVDPDGCLFLVADGLGGHAAGEVASAIAVETVAAAAPLAGQWRDPEQELPAVLARADAQVRERATGPCYGMGATVVALLLQPDGRVLVVHAGDSRAYRLRDGSLRRLTRAHTPEAESGRPDALPRSSVITRALGAGDAVEFDLRWVDALPDDRFLLCSDGLTDMVTDAQIAGQLKQDLSPAAHAAALVEAALAGGGRDNVTVVVVTIA